MAERVGFEPTCRLPDKTLSRRPRYDHFGTSPSACVNEKRTYDYSPLPASHAIDGLETPAGRRTSRS